MFTGHESFPAAKEGKIPGSDIETVPNYDLLMETMPLAPLHKLELMDVHRALQK